MASTSFGFFGAALARQATASTHSRAFFMMSRFFQGITQFMKLRPCHCIRPLTRCTLCLHWLRPPASSCCTFPVECACNPLIFGCSDSDTQMHLKRRKLAEESDSCIP